MRTLTWVLRGVLFIALFLFAVKNTDSVSLRFYFDQVWQAPLILVLLAFFAAGAATGVLACMATVFRQRREMMQLRRELRSRGHAEAAQAPAGDPGADAFPGI
jgi:putative membrane protein